MKYRKPMKDVQDRHALIELGGDFTNDEISHILNHAYLEHKAPHEYNELKKYIKDIVIGRHNSVYIMANGSPEPLASASILASPYISNYSGQIYYDYVFSASTSTGATWSPACLTNNATNCNSISSSAGCAPISWEPISIKYNNGEAWQWGLFYTPTVITTGPSGLYVTLSPVVTYRPVYTIINATFGYAPYVSSTNPLTLTTYFYWSPGSSSYSYSYVYFTVNMNPNDINNVYGGVFLVPLFYSTGQYNFNSDTYYISMWQFTYT